MKANEYNIMYSKKFNTKVSEIIEYMIYNLQKRTMAENFLKELEIKLNIIRKFPKLFIEKEYNGIRLRKFNVYNYSIFYSVQTNGILIYDIFYSRRNFDDLIKK